MIPDELKPILVSPNASILETMKAIDAGAIQIAMIVDDSSRLVGVLTDGDLRRAILKGAELSDSIEPYINQTFRSVSDKASRNEALDLMKCFTIKQLPILNEAGQLCGLHSLNKLIRREVLPNAAMILAGGRGTRLGKLTQSTPKPMIKVAGRPILERIVLHLVGAGIRQIFISVNYLSEVIESHFGSGEQFGCEIHYLHETEPLGTGGPLSLLKPFDLNAPLLVMNGDLIVDFDVAGILETHLRHQNMITIGARAYSHEVPFGCLQTDGTQVTEIVEKPTHRETINAGIYVISTEMFAAVPQEFFPITQLVENAINQQQRVGMYPIDEWIDVGLPENLAEARGIEG